MSKPLQPVFNGNPILRETARHLSDDEIRSDEVQQFAKGMYAFLDGSDYGIGLAAPQLGENIALFVLNVSPTPTLPDLEPYQETFINPTILEATGDPKNMREGCISLGHERL